LDKLNSKAIDLDVTLLDKKIDQMMPELGFKPSDNDRLVASFSGGWQMRMCLGKLLLQVRGYGGGAGCPSLGGNLGHPISRRATH
jgi:ATPase subunit of ABC transporter with duplicated ATPase domains